MMNGIVVETHVYSMNNYHHSTGYQNGINTLGTWFIAALNKCTKKGGGGKGLFSSPLLKDHAYSKH